MKLPGQGVLLSYEGTWPAYPSLLWRYLARVSFSFMEIPGQGILLFYGDTWPGYPSLLWRYLARVSFSYMEIPGQGVLLSSGGTWAGCPPLLWRYLASRLRHKCPRFHSQTGTTWIMNLCPHRIPKHFDFTSSTKMCMFHLKITIPLKSKNLKKLI